MAARVRLSLKEKIEIINEYTFHKSSVRQLASQFNIGKTQVGKILNNKKDLLEEWGKYNNLKAHPHAKKTFTPNSPGLIIDQIMYDWFCQAQEAKVRINGPILREKALEVAQFLNIEDFKASYGWLDKFKIRHNISFKPTSEETPSTDTNIKDEWKEKLYNISCVYNQADIFNCDEIGLFFRAHPDDAKSLKNMSCSRGEFSNERLTVMLCTNMLGEFEKSLVIGSVQNSLPFNDVESSVLDIDWQSNNNAWINNTIFHRWLSRLNDKMASQKRNIVLFMDSAASHPLMNFSNMNIVYWPSNASVADQPLRNGIIKHFKVNYRSCLLTHLLANTGISQLSSDIAKNISVLNAFQWISSSVRKIPKETIFKCFEMSGFLRPLNEAPSCEVVITVETDVPKQENEISNYLTINRTSNDKIRSFLDIDAKVATELDPSENIDIQEGAKSSEDMDYELKAPPQINGSPEKFKEALTMINNLKQMFTGEGDFDGLSLILSLQANVENKIVSQKEVQSRVEHFFL